jgi:hypothetical protein
MPTLLVNARMNPALAERVEASVTGRRKSPTGRVSPSVVRRLVAWARVVLVVALAAAVYTGVTTYQHTRRALEAKRAELVGIVTIAQADVTAKDRSAVDRAAGWVNRLAGPYDGDVAAPPGLAAELLRPAIYVRGAIDTMRTRESLAGAAARGRASVGTIREHTQRVVRARPASVSYAPECHERSAAVAVVRSRRPVDVSSTSTAADG